MLRPEWALLDTQTGGRGHHYDTSNADERLSATKGARAPGDKRRRQASSHRRYVWRQWADRGWPMAVVRI